jgi:thymidine kinase
MSLVCASCGREFGTADVDVDGQAVYVEDGVLKIGGHYVAGSVTPYCTECSDA